MQISVLLIAGLLAVASPAYAYPEYPPFEQTQFADDLGMFRWWESCWWRVFDPYVYLQCDPGGDIFIVLPDGTVTEASDSDLDRLYRESNGVVSFNAPGTSGSRLGVSRFFPSRTSAAPGDGIRLSDYYGGTFTRFDGNGSSSGLFGNSGTSSNSSGVFRFSGTRNDVNRQTILGFDVLNSGDLEPTGVFTAGSDGVLRPSTTFRFSDGSNDYQNNGNTFRFSGDNSGPQRIAGQEVPTSAGAGSTGAFSGGDGFFSENNLRTRMDDFFYQPLGLIGCTSIDDSRDGGIFGPIPCTSYPGVLGPVPRY